MTYAETITAAINDLAENGYSETRLSYWQREIRAAAERSFRTMAQMEADLKAAMGAIYRRMIDNGGAAKFHPGVGRFTLDRLKPELRLALERRQTASRELIKLNREESMLREQRRLAGWASSIPPGGTDQVARAKLKAEIKKPLASLPFEERRVIIDQGHKLAANINLVIAEGGNAIAAKWHDRGKTDRHYDARPEHLARSGKIFLIRGSWALEAGLIKPVNGYTDEIEQVAELPFCSCWYEYFYNLRQLPFDMLTKKGETALAEAREKLREMV